MDFGWDFRNHAIMGTGLAAAVDSVGDRLACVGSASVIGLWINCGADGGLRFQLQPLRASARFPGANGHAARARDLRDRLADLGKNSDAKRLDAARSHHPVSSSERRDADQGPDRLRVSSTGARSVRMATAENENGRFGVVGLDAVAAVVF